MKGDLKRKTRARNIYHYLLRSIKENRFSYGQKLPTEVELCRRFKVSRPTVARAMQKLKQEGLIERKAGAGSYVSWKKESINDDRKFGLLIPGLGDTELFESICAQMASLSRENNFTLIWGGAIASTSVYDALVTEQVCEQYIDQKVDGIFFSPCELMPSMRKINLRITEKLDEAGIPIVLIDRDIVPFPERSRYDLVGIDNFRAGYLAAHHLLRLNSMRVDFFFRPNSAPTVAMRIRGYMAALQQAGIRPELDWIHGREPDDLGYIKCLITEKGINCLICANDVTAGAVMHSLDELGIRIPQDVLIVGFDDIKSAEHLRSPLTTLRQPSKELGILAIQTMLNRLDNPDIPARDILLNATLVIRKSCGIELYQEKQQL